MFAYGLLLNFRDLMLKFRIYIKLLSRKMSYERVFVFNLFLKIPNSVIILCVKSILRCKILCISRNNFIKKGYAFSFLRLINFNLHLIFFISKNTDTCAILLVLNLSKHFLLVYFDACILTLSYINYNPIVTNDKNNYKIKYVCVISNVLRV